MDPEEAKRRVVWGVMQLLEEEGELMARDIHEQTTTGHLTGLLKPLFVPQGYRVDAEYNRDYESTKRMNIPPPGNPLGTVKPRTVKPDILVHKRDEYDADGAATYEGDLVVIEAKKGGASEADARIKLRAFMEQHFGYKVAVLLSINVSPHRVEASLEFIGGETIVIGRDVA